MCSACVNPRRSPHCGQLAALALEAGARCQGLRAGCRWTVSNLGGRKGRSPQGEVALLPEKALEQAGVTLAWEDLSSVRWEPKLGFPGRLGVALQILKAGEACWAGP